eukprot:IDg18076t1
MVQVASQGSDTTKRYAFSFLFASISWKELNKLRERYGIAKNEAHLFSSRGIAKIGAPVFKPKKRFQRYGRWREPPYTPPHDLNKPWGSVSVSRHISYARHQQEHVYDYKRCATTYLLTAEAKRIVHELVPECSTDVAVEIFTIKTAADRILNF